MAVDEASDGGYAELFDAHFWGLVRFARLLGADDPEDVAQEAFVRLHRKQRALRDPNASLAYLRTTVCNLTRNRLRHLGVARRRSHLAPPQDVASAEASAVGRESVRELIAALGGLPRRQRETLVLRYWLDLTEREAAEVLGVGIGTVKTHAARGIAALGRTLGEAR
ncbi:sigma-70 family RNA polymerase sigma factor [Actinomadura parmotrematis]|nr:sigma-70 family RNA polymerase sigma factor [Actinomadura parmotrematis]